MKFRILAIFLLGLFLSTGCNKSSGDATEADQKAPRAEPTQKTGESADKNGDDSAAARPKNTDSKALEANRYPGFNFGALSQEERARFVNVAKAELCPCPDSSVSLDECLSKPALQCGIAQQSATVIAMGIKEGLNQTDILDQLAEFIEVSRKAHEFDLSQIPFKGDADASVKIVEFADFQCPYCREAANTLDAAHKKFGDDVAIYFMNFPLSAHSEAELAARAAVAAQKQGKFWPMHDLLFQHQKQLSPSKIDQFARQIGVNFDKFKKDLNDPATAQRVRTDKAAGEKANITGTPTIFINGTRYMGDRSQDAIIAAIESAIEDARSN